MSWVNFDPDIHHGRKLLRSADGKLILKASLVADTLPQSWVEGAAWSTLETLPEGPLMRFCPTLSSGSQIISGDIWAWNIQPFVGGYNAHSQRQMLPESPFMRHVIAEAREKVKSVGFDDKDIIFPGQYQYLPDEKIAVCVDYGKVIVATKTCQVCGADRPDTFAGCRRPICPFRSST